MYQCINISMFQCINISMYQCINVSMYQYINASMYQYINVSMYQCINLFINLSIYQFINLSTFTVYIYVYFKPTHHPFALLSTMSYTYLRFRLPIYYSIPFSLQFFLCTIPYLFPPTHSLSLYSDCTLISVSILVLTNLICNLLLGLPP